MSVFELGSLAAGRYRIVQLIGQGGMAEIYEAHDETESRRVALKVLSPVFLAKNPHEADRNRERFRREADILAALADSPHVVDVLEFGDHEGLLYIAQEYLDGPLLAERVFEDEGIKPSGLLIPVARQLVRGMGDIHRSGIVHRDIAANNVFLLDPENAARARVVYIDFGVSKNDENITQDMRILMGQLPYLAPERVGGFRGGGGDDKDPRGDIYSLGVLLYRMIVGRWPIMGLLSVTQMPRIRTDPPVALSQFPATERLPLGVADAVMRMLAKKPEQRPTLEEVDAILSAAEDFAAASGGSGRGSDPTIGLPAQEPQTLDLSDQVIEGSIRLHEVIGRGSMGAVYRAYHQAAECDVAVKVASGSDKSIFEEARKLLTVAHPNIVKVMSVGRHLGHSYLVMQLIKGRDLERLVEDDGRLSESAFWEVASRVCDGLEYVHQLPEPVIHNDLKPSNILLDDASQEPRIADFGISRRIPSGATDTGGTSGLYVDYCTVDYASPEQLERKIPDERSDIYGLGGVFYYLLTGQVPFEGDGPLQVAGQKISGVPPAPSRRGARCNRRVDAVLLRCLDPEPSRRPQSVGEVRHLLDVALHGQARKGGPGLAKTLAAAVVLLLIGLGVWAGVDLSATIPEIGEPRLLVVDTQQRLQGGIHWIKDDGNWDLRLTGEPSEEWEVEVQAFSDVAHREPAGVQPLLETKRSGAAGISLRDSDFEGGRSFRLIARPPVPDSMPLVKGMVASRAAERARSLLIALDKEPPYLRLEIDGEVVSRPEGAYRVFARPGRVGVVDEGVGPDPEKNAAVLATLAQRPGEQRGQIHDLLGFQHTVAFELLPVQLRLRGRQLEDPAGELLLEILPATGTPPQFEAAVSAGHLRCALPVDGGEAAVVRVEEDRYLARFRVPAAWRSEGRSGFTPLFTWGPETIWAEVTADEVPLDLMAPRWEAVTAQGGALPAAPERLVLRQKSLRLQLPVDARRLEVDGVVTPVVDRLVSLTPPTGARGGYELVMVDRFGNRSASRRLNWERQFGEPVVSWSAEDVHEDGFRIWYRGAELRLRVEVPGAEGIEEPRVTIGGGVSARVDGAAGGWDYALRADRAQPVEVSVPTKKPQRFEIAPDVEAPVITAGDLSATYADDVVSLRVADLGAGLRTLRFNGEPVEAGPDGSIAGLRARAGENELVATDQVGNSRRWRHVFARRELGAITLAGSAVRDRQTIYVNGPVELVVGTNGPRPAVRGLDGEPEARGSAWVWRFAAQGEGPREIEISLGSDLRRRLTVIVDRTRPQVRLTGPGDEEVGDGPIYLDSWDQLRDYHLVVTDLALVTGDGAWDGLAERQESAPRRKRRYQFDEARTRGKYELAFDEGRWGWSDEAGNRGGSPAVDFRLRPRLEGDPLRAVIAGNEGPCPEGGAAVQRVLLRPKWKDGRAGELRLRAGGRDVVVREDGRLELPEGASEIAVFLGGAGGKEIVRHRVLIDGRPAVVTASPALPGSGEELFFSWPAPPRLRVRVEEACELSLTVGGDGKTENLAAGGGFLHALPRAETATPLRIATVDAAGNRWEWQGTYRCQPRPSVSVEVLALVGNEAVPVPADGERVQGLIVRPRWEEGREGRLEITWSGQPARLGADGRVFPPQGVGELLVRRADGPDEVLARHRLLVDRQLLAPVVTPSLPAAGRDLPAFAPETDPVLRVRAREAMSARFVVGGQERREELAEGASFELSLPRTEARTSLRMVATDSAGNRWEWSGFFRCRKKRVDPDPGPGPGPGPDPGPRARPGTLAWREVFRPTDFVEVRLPDGKKVWMAKYELSIARAKELAAKIPSGGPKASEVDRCKRWARFLEGKGADYNLTESSTSARDAERLAELVEGVRLPTLAEWIYAATQDRSRYERAKTRSDVTSGNTGRDSGRHLKVEELSRSSLGLYGMLEGGNEYVVQPNGQIKLRGDGTNKRNPGIRLVLEEAPR